MGVFLGLGVFAVIGIVVLIVSILIPMLYRMVVPTNSVHIVQRRKKTVAYGRDLADGNVYYAWPSWLPVVGISSIVLPTSIFDINLDGYDAFDVGRVPFRVDITAFFKVDKAETAAQRVESFEEMHSQLRNILRGVVRNILASADIEEIMQGRSVFGEMFTAKLEEQLQAWGVSTVKNIEFMDIKDSDGSHVIANIMKKKQSLIEKESRTVVASNKKDAQMAEIDAVKEADVRQQEADLLVGQKNADKNRQIGIADETAKQEIQEQARITTEKDMAVLKVRQERQADIDKNVAVIESEQDKEVRRLAAEAVLIQQQREADGVKVTAEAELANQKFNAEGILVVGTSKAEAEKLMLMAPVDAQITLAQEIGGNARYMEYLLGIKGLDVGEEVGKAKAAALYNSDLKVIANAGNVEGGVTKLLDIFSTSGGTQIGGMLEGLAQTDVGKELLTKLTGKKEDSLSVE